ncbi:HAMP domain-containing histidine kinase [Bacillus infantis]|uniref:sensor histidine kinase n=1 Tax=Bacillus infantis TaxID=324767 RepID=UPI002006D5CB|nr:HAMP domain-containing sensor histidine kinase [Bacillus infantis]MCK6205804.1 HAMP domain-containing histidine kinase [Bacillus infantis]
MKNGIGKRLAGSYLVMIIITVALFEAVILSALRLYYMGGVKQALRDQGSMFSVYYEQYFQTRPLKDSADQLLQQYNFLLDAKVQIVGKDGALLSGSSLSEGESLKGFQDIESALSGTTGYWTGTEAGEKLLSVARPILVSGEPVGAIRLTTSLEQLNEVFLQNASALIMIGLAVILIAGIISYFLANTIIKPVSRITEAAELMASGKFSVRIKKERDDEVGLLADTLNYMAEEAEKHEKLKNEFIASVSHELRTPLTSVKGWALTLRSMTDEKVFTEGLDIITDESERLSHLLGELLDLSSLSSGKAGFVFERILLQKMVQQTVNQLRPRATRQNILLSSEITEEPLFLNADRDRLKQVLLNVLDNSLKFTPAEGTISVALKRKEKEAVIIVSDTGAGIPSDELEAVKEKFYKGKIHGAGTGLGLAICQEIIAAHQGQFELASERGKGTAAYIRLPL